MALTSKIDILSRLDVGRANNSDNYDTHLLFRDKLNSWTHDTIVGEV